MYASFNARVVGLASLSAETTVDLAAGAGFAAVDLMVRDLLRSGGDPKSVRSRMDDLGLVGGAFPCPVDWRGDDATYRRGLDALPAIGEAASVLGLRRTGTWVMPETPSRPLDETERRAHRDEITSLHVERIGAIARTLDVHGIRLGLEVIGVTSSRTGQGDPYVTRLADLDSVLGEIWEEAPNLGILLDAFHLNAANEGIEAGLAWGIGRVVWVHVADLPPSAVNDRALIRDADRGLPGENGAVDVRNFLGHLAAVGYDGPVTAEPLENCRSLVGLEPGAIARRVKDSLDWAWPGAQSVIRSAP